MRLTLPLARETGIDEVAALDKDTVQMELLPEFTLEGAQPTEVNTTGGAVKLKNAVFETPFEVAVTMAEESVEMVPAVAAKEAVDWPLDTVTQAGTVREALLLDKATTVLAVAAPERLTVQEEDVPEVRLAGPQLSPDREMVTGVVTVTVPPVAVSVRLVPSVEAATGAVT
jgi:hypothetical protein